MSNELYLLINLRKYAAKCAINPNPTSLANLREWIDKVDKYFDHNEIERVEIGDPHFKSLLQQFKDGEL